MTTISPYEAACLHARKSNAMDLLLEGGGGGGGTHSAEEGQNPLAEHVPPDRIHWRIVSPRTVPASGLCPPGQNPLADSVRGDTFWVGGGGGGGGGGGTKSAMTAVKR